MLALWEGFALVWLRGTRVGLVLTNLTKHT